MSEIHAVRTRALTLLGEYTAGRVEGAQKEILVDGGWDGKSLPSADFCHWFLWKMGCKDSRILSRNVPESSIVRTGDLFKKLSDGAQRLGAWKPFQLETTPSPGDILLSGNRKKGEQERARVVTAVDGPKLWHVVDVWMDKETMRLAEVPTSVRGEDLVRPSGREVLVGWVDLLLALGDAAGPGE